MKIYLSLSLILVLTGCFAIAEDQEQAKDSASATSIANSKRQEILEEIKNLKDHEWAGDYSAGDGLGVNTSIILAPKSGYVFEWYGCLGLYDRNYGAVTWADDGRLRLSFTFENKREGFEGIAPELIPISWGPRRYLIPTDDIVKFCNSVNEGEEPRNHAGGFYLLRLGDEKKAVTGLPKVPEEYQSYLLAKPIEATIIAIGPYTTRPSTVKWKFKDTPVTLNVGTRQGLRMGMELFVTSPQNIIESVQVTKAEETHSEGIMTQTGEEEPGPKVGWRLSTQSPRYAQPALLQKSKNDK